MSFLPDIDRTRVPEHVAIVMDGNGRWAQQRGLPRTEGHGAGEDALWDTVKGANEVGVRWLTVYAFSTENWKRPQPEVLYLMNFNRELLRRRRDELNEMNVRIRWSGRRDWRVPRQRAEGDAHVRGAHARQHRHDADDRVQLRRARRDRRRGEGSSRATCARAP